MRAKRVSGAVWLSRALASFIAAALLTALACTKPAPTDATTPTADASPSGSAAQPRPPDSEEESVHSVYPLDIGTPDPLAVRLCGALHDLPEERRASCCAKKPALVVTSECVRMLTGALHFKAVRLDAADVERCAAALAHLYEGCDWVGPWSPEPPPECDGVIHGALANGASCRSSLECGAGLRCHGAGPTNAGVCGAPHREAEGCGGTVDALAVYTKATRLDAAHPECEGYCDRHRCSIIVAMGGECKYEAQCGPAGHCASGKCAARVVAKVGEACGDAACEATASCVRKVCVARGASGAPCITDLECRGACLREGGASRGTCGPGCSVR